LADLAANEKSGRKQKLRGQKTVAIETSCEDVRCLAIANK
jgi:hypothetical protein